MSRSGGELDGRGRRGEVLASDVYAWPAFFEPLFFLGGVTGRPAPGALLYVNDFFFSAGLRIWEAARGQLSALAAGGLAATEMQADLEGAQQCVVHTHL